jgi:hypothetical protein
MQLSPTFRSTVTARFRTPGFVLGVYIFITVIASLAEMGKGPHVFDGTAYTHYNNYLIFKYSFFHLIHGQDLYTLYPKEHWDLYKYSPSFAVCMGLWAYLPDFMGLILWNLLNALVLFFAVRQLPVGNDRMKVAVLWLVLLEMLTSIQNAQSNALIAGLIIFAFSFFEKRHLLPASLCIVLTVFIKLFGLVALALFLLYPRKLTFIGYTIGWTLLLALFPLLFVSANQLEYLYVSWLRLLAADHSTSLGLSVMGWLESWFGLTGPKNTVVLAGVLLFGLPLLRRKAYPSAGFRLLLLASVLIWVVIFNHRAESPTFVIAMSGVALWYFSQERRKENLLLLCLAFALTSLSPTDLFPAYVRDHLVVPYTLKAVPCILIWFKILYEMLVYPVQQPLASALTQPDL